MRARGHDDGAGDSRYDSKGSKGRPQKKRKSSRADLCIGALVLVNVCVATYILVGRAGAPALGLVGEQPNGGFQGAAAESQARSPKLAAAYEAAVGAAARATRRARDQEEGAVSPDGRGLSVSGAASRPPAPAPKALTADAQEAAAQPVTATPPVAASAAAAAAVAAAGTASLPGGGGSSGLHGPPRHELHASWEAWVGAGRPHGDRRSAPAVAAAGGVVHHLPHFSIIGAQKAGTTYLRWLLVQHPHLESGDGLHGEARGEPHFFDWGYPGGAADGSAAVAAKYAKTFHLPKAKFDAGHGSALFFDTTPAYVVETATVPKRLHALLPRLKLIAIVRDPTDRYRSELQMEICRARLGEISDQFHAHGAMGAYLAYPPAPDHKPLRRGLYFDQLSAWLQTYQRDQLLVLTSDLLYKDTAAATASVLSFLEVDAEAEGFKGFNFKAPKNAACAKDMGPFVDAAELAGLRAYYKKHNQGLSTLVDVTFPWLDDNYSPPAPKD